MRICLFLIGLISTTRSSASLDPGAVVCRVVYDTLAVLLTDITPRDIMTVIHEVLPNHRVSVQEISDRIISAIALGVRSIDQHARAMAYSRGIPGERDEEDPLIVSWAELCTNALVKVVKLRPCHRVKYRDRVVWRLRDDVYTKLFREKANTCANDIYPAE